MAAPRQRKVERQHDTAGTYFCLHCASRHVGRRNCFAQHLPAPQPSRGPTCPCSVKISCVAPRACSEARCILPFKFVAPTNAGTSTERCRGSLKPEQRRCGALRQAMAAARDSIAANWRKSIGAVRLTQRLLERDALAAPGKVVVHVGRLSFKQTIR